MAASCLRPLILPLSNERPEVTAQDAYTWTKGQCLVATGDERAEPVLSGGILHHPSQATSLYIFPGGCYSQSSHPSLSESFRTWHQIQSA